MNETSSACNSRFAIASEPPVMARCVRASHDGMDDQLQVSSQSPGHGDPRPFFGSDRYLPPVPHPAQTPSIQTSRDQP